DEESLEWMQLVGLDLKNAEDLEFGFGAYNEADNPFIVRGLALTMAECHKAHDANWQSADGSADFVPLGDFVEPHHSSCYRVYNIDREVAAHHYTLGGAGALPLNIASPTWAELQNHIAQLGPAPGSGSGAGMGIVSGCRFAP